MRSVPSKLYHLGFRGNIARSTLADANRLRDWRIYADFAQVLIGHARNLYIDQPLGFELSNTAYALDSTTIDLCLSLFPWAPFRKRNFDYRRLESHPIDKQTGLRSDQTVVLAGIKTSIWYPGKLRRVHYFDAECDKRFIFLTNNFTLPALTITELYRCRWRIEWFFKWIKQHLRIKAFYGNSANAVRTQVWIAMSVYLLVAILKKELRVDRSLSEILQILSVNPFEKTLLLPLLTESNDKFSHAPRSNQLPLFDL